MSSDDRDESESVRAESDIYEDPATTHEGVIPNIDPLDLRMYLVINIGVLHKN